MYKGIDVSKWQGQIDFKDVKNEVDFVIIRIGYGRFEDQIDPKFETYYKDAKENDLKIGVYLYSYALSVEDAILEAETAIKWLSKRKLNLPVYYDIEDKTQSNLSKDTITRMCRSFCEKIEDEGYKAGVYSDKYFLTDHIDTDQLENYSIWVADYSNVNTYDGRYDIWQYTSRGKVEGIDGNVDRDILYRNIFDDGNNEITKLPDLSNYKGDSIVDALNSIGYDSSFSSRRNLYREAGFTDTYVGSAKQNLELLRKLGAKEQYYPKPNYNGFSIVDALKEIDVDSSFENRRKIAQANGIDNYTGSFWQNVKLLNLLKQGKLIRE